MKLVHVTDLHLVAPFEQLSQGPSDGLGIVGLLDDPAGLPRCDRLGRSANRPGGFWARADPGSP